MKKSVKLSKIKETVENLDSIKKSIHDLRHMHPMFVEIEVRALDNNSRKKIIRVLKEAKLKCETKLLKAKNN